MTHRRRSPRPIAAALDRAERSWQPTTALGEAQTAWDRIARAWALALGPQGSYVLERTTPVSLRAGVLTVRCSESVVADALTLESAGLIDRLDAELSGERVTGLRAITCERRG